MVSRVFDAPGIRLTAADLLSLREAVPHGRRHRPTSRRPGSAAARVAGAGMDLREIRVFGDGDDARRIDPSATARTGMPHVRSFHADRDDTLLLIADFRTAMLWGTGPSLRSVRAARLLAGRGWQTVAQGGAVAALVVADTGCTFLSSAGGVAQMGRISRMLASQHDLALGRRGDTAALAEALRRGAGLVPAGADVLIATGPAGVTTADEAALERLARHRRATLLLPLDPLETAPPARVLPLRCGGAVRLAQVQAFDAGPLARRLRAVNVDLELCAP